MRIEPPPSLPVQIGIIPTATAAAEPPDEPPGVRSGFHGLRVTPWRYVRVQLVDPNSGEVVSPTSTAPAAAQPRGLGRGVVGDLVLEQHRRVRVGPALDGDELLHAHRHAGPHARDPRPARRRRRSPRPRARAPSTSRKQNALSSSLNRSTRARNESSRSTAFSSPARTSSASSHASRSHNSRHRFPRSVAIFTISANASSIPPASTSRSPPASRSAHSPKCSVPS